MLIKPRIKLEVEGAVNSADLSAVLACLPLGTQVESQGIAEYQSVGFNIQVKGIQSAREFLDAIEAMIQGES